MSIESGNLADLTQSTLLVGDNLDILPLIKKNYSGKFKCIYLDPPYNDGSQVYYDFPNKSEEWLQEINVRLHFLRDCLHEKGALIISISDYEFPRIRILAEKIFGRENYVTSLIWLTKKGAQGIPRKTMVMPNHEYIMVFAKDIACFSFRGKTRPIEKFSNPDHDPRGPWKRQYLQRFGKNFSSKTIINPENRMAFTFETPYTYKKLKEWIRDERIVFPNNPQQYPMKKEFHNEYSKPQQLTTFLGLYPTKSNTESLNQLFDGVKIFPYTKPVKLMMDLFEWICGPDDWILDPYAGSGTTGEAVLRLNVGGESERKCFLIQKREEIPPKEPSYKAGYYYIDEITRERIIRVEKELGLEPSMNFYIWQHGKVIAITR